MNFILTIVILFFFSTCFAEENSKTIQELVDQALASKWYNKMNLRGYAQFRYNRLLETNQDLKCKQCDKSIGENQGFFVRRVRLVLFGDLTDRIYFYMQPDFATADSGGKQNYSQIRDLYFDYALNSSKQLRLRGGVSKVPYGFENLQSSSNRPALDRNDAMNSAVPNERDIGVYLMWNSAFGRKFFQEVTQKNLKGSGDYGMVSIGAINGQTLNAEEKNNGLHTVARLTLPYKTFGGQYFEASLQGYAGKFVIDGEEYLDERQAISFIMYPQPFGIQVEWNTGLGPEFNPSEDRVVVDRLDGGYVQAMYQFVFEGHRFYPYARWTTYDGGKKGEKGTKYDVNELEFGSEWSPAAAFELTLAYVISKRQTWGGEIGETDQSGNLLRIQAQINF
jgi:hypothetical protein